MVYNYYMNFYDLKQFEFLLYRIRKSNEEYVVLLAPVRFIVYNEFIIKDRRLPIDAETNKVFFSGS